MSTQNRKRLRRPSERVGTVLHAALPPPGGAPDEEERLLLRALRQRDEQAFSTLLDRWYSPMLRLARTYVRTPADAEEVVQDTWLAVLRGLERFEGRSTLKTWVFRILVNRARTRATREARTVPLSAIPALRGDGGIEADTPEPEWLLHQDRTGPLAWHGVSLGQNDPHETLLSAELRRRIETAIRALPERQQEVITLRDLEGWSAEEVCETLEISAANQRVLLHRARTRVRDALFPVRASL